MPIPTVSSIPTAWHGKVALTYTRQGDKTVPEVQTQAPLKVQRPFYPEGAASCHSVILHTAGGLVGGDRLSYDLALAPDTHALITTPAAAKVYSGTADPHAATITGRIQVAAGACLEWLPQETIVFEGARYHADWRVDLAAGATWMGWDILRLGRTARGEQFLRGEVRSRVAVYQGDRLVWLDPQHLFGNETTWHSPHALGECPVLATFVWIGTLPPKAWVAAARSHWDAIPDPQGTAGGTRLQSGLLCRYRGHSTEVARRWFYALWRELRPHYLNKPGIWPRVWQR